MAFVYRSPHKNILHNETDTPGPGNYNPLPSPTTKQTPVPFGIKSHRQIFSKSITPGPGEYQFGCKEIDGEDVVYSNPHNKFVMTSKVFSKDTPGDYAFKSKSKRIQYRQSGTPGPGQYDVNVGISKSSPRAVSAPKATKLTRYLYNQTKKIGQISQQGQNNNSAFQFGKNKQNIAETHSQEKKSQSKKNGFGFVFNSKVQRQPLSRPQTSTGVGPGSYNILDAYSNKKSYHTKPKDREQFFEKDVKYVQPVGTTQEVGPGYYYVQKSSVIRPQTSFSRGIPCFGSKQSRFGNEKFENQRKENSPGPQDYFKAHKSSKTLQGRSQGKKRPAFNSTVSSSHDFITLVPNAKFTQVSPFSYNPKNDFNELLKKNYMKGSAGGFGSTVERFKESQTKNTSETQSTIQFGLKDKPSLKNMKSKSCSSVKRRRKPEYSFQSGRHERPTDIDDRPVCYDVDSRTIGSKFTQKQQMQAPFMTASQRFASVPYDYQKQLFEALKESHQKLALVKQPNPKKQKILKGRVSGNLHKKYIQIAKSDTLIQKQQIKESIGPQSYDAVLPKKQSFNVLFRN